VEYVLILEHPDGTVESHIHETDEEIVLGSRIEVGPEGIEVGSRLEEDFRSGSRCWEVTRRASLDELLRLPRVGTATYFCKPCPPES
jgi:hypothetical protein